MENTASGKTPKRGERDNQNPIAWQGQCLGPGLSAHGSKAHRRWGTERRPMKPPPRRPAINTRWRDLSKDTLSRLSTGLPGRACHGHWGCNGRLELLMDVDRKSFPLLGLQVFRKLSEEGPPLGFHRACRRPSVLLICGIGVAVGRVDLLCHDRSFRWQSGPPPHGVSIWPA